MPGTTRIGMTLGLAAVLVAGTAHAHTGVDASASFASGFLHPLAGVDHILGMIAVGLWAVQLGGPGLWLLPAAFVAALLGGATAGVGGLPLPVVEFGIAGGLALLGLVVAVGTRSPTWAAIAAVAVFGAFHGFAHGATIPVTGSVSLYALGLVLATAAVLGLGTVLRLAAGTTRSRAAIRVGGATIAALGALMIATSAI